MAQMLNEYKTVKPKTTVTNNVVSQKKIDPVVPPNIWEAPILKPITQKPVVVKPTVAPVTAAPKAVVPKTVTPKATTPTTKGSTQVGDISIINRPKASTQVGEIILNNNAEKLRQARLNQLKTQTAQPVEAQPTAQAQQETDISALINALNQAKQEQAVANLGKSRDTQLSNLSGEEAAIKPMYYDKRNTTAATNMMGRRTLSEELAARGETRSGVADQANINANMSLQGETGLLNRQEAADITDIARRRTGVQNAYESDVASARSGFESAAMQNLIDQYNADRAFKLQESGVTGTYSGNQTLAAQNQAFNQNMTTQQYNQAVKQQKLDNLYRTQTFDYQKSRDAVGDSQWQQSMNLNLRQQSFSEAQQKIENALSQRRISQEDASQALQWARFNSEQDPNSLDNQYKQAQINAASEKTNTGTTSTVDDYASTINSIYVVSPNANNNYQGSLDTAGIKTYLDKLIMSGVDETIIDSLAARYGIQ